MKSNILSGKTIQEEKSTDLKKNSFLSDPHHRLLLQTFLETEDWINSKVGPENISIFRQ